MNYVGEGFAIDRLFGLSGILISRWCAKGKQESECNLQAIAQGEMFSISCITHILKYKSYDILYSPFIFN